MCTAITYEAKDFYFGRTLDYEHGFGEELILTQRNFPLLFRHCGLPARRYAILGMGCVADGYPLYFDAFNEKGLAMAGLNFVGYAYCKPVVSGRDNIAQFELIPWILGQCGSVAEAKRLLERINITDEAFRTDIPPADLHWMIADRKEAITVESVKEGLRIYQNPVGVLTNNPPFNEQLFRINDFMHLSPKQPENRFSANLRLQPYSRGMGAMGLPGDLSSQSRFVRAAFTKLNALSGEDENGSVSQYFHILGSVEQVKGCCDLGNGQFEHTIYASCCNVSRGIYYYKTYDNHCICAVDMRLEDPEGTKLLRWPLQKRMKLEMQNGKAQN